MIYIFRYGRESTRREVIKHSLVEKQSHIKRHPEAKQGYSRGIAFSKKESLIPKNLKRRGVAERFRGKEFET